MSGFNAKAKGIRTTNLSGHAAYSMDDKSKLMTQVLTSFVNEKKFYGDNTAEMQGTIQNVIQTDPEFVAKLAVYARREFHMRTVSHALAAYLAHEEKGKPYARKVMDAVTLRGDDVTDATAFYLSTFGKPIPHALQDGICDALGRFDEYTLAKYKGEGKTVKMRDLICLCRPRPKNDAQSVLFKRCLDGTLEIPYTWETELSAKGNTNEVWESLIDSGKVGYMALLRNLRNIINANPSNIEKVWQRIEDPEAVRKSKQLPFRFLSAYKEIYGIAGSRGLDALENAVDASIANVPRFPGTTVIAVDVSGSMGSMGSTLSARSSVRCGDVAMLLGRIATHICDNAIFYTFDTRLTRYPASSRSGILYSTVNTRFSGGGTDMELPFLEMMHCGIKADRIITLSDNECNSSYYKPVQSVADKYRRQTGNNIWVHAIDLQGYGTQQFHGARTNIIAGWSEKVLNFILLAEQGAGNLIQTIQDYEIDRTCPSAKPDTDSTTTAAETQSA